MYNLHIKKTSTFMVQVQVKSLHSSQVAHQAGAYPGFCRKK